MERFESVITSSELRYFVHVVTCLFNECGKWVVSPTYRHIQKRIYNSVSRFVFKWLDLVYQAIPFDLEWGTKSQKHSRTRTLSNVDVNNIFPLQLRLEFEPWLVQKWSVRGSLWYWLREYLLRTEVLVRTFNFSVLPTKRTQVICYIWRDLKHLWEDENGYKNK